MSFAGGRRKCSLQTISDYLNTLDQSLLVGNELYNKRLAFCKKCEYLISGMCRKCGCYVEIRAALKDKACPDYDSKKW